MDAILKKSHEEKYLEQGWLLALGFLDGWACFRIQHKAWALLEPWSLGAVAALGNLAAYNEVVDANSRHYLEPYDEKLIYHTFWGVTPAPARIFAQYPPRANLGSMLAVDRIETGNVGYIDGRKSPFNGPFSDATELITIAGLYPAFQAYNPLNDPMYNVMLNFDQRHYTYEIIKDMALIKDILLGKTSRKMYTMGRAAPAPTAIPKWLKDDVTSDLLKYSLNIMGGKS